MRILFYNHTELVSGAERVLLTICKNLDRAEFEVTVACPEGPLAQLFRAIEIPVLPAGVLRARFTWRVDRMLKYLLSVITVARGFRRTVAMASPDLIHANSVRAGIIASLATVGMPVRIIWHVHDVLKRHPLSTAIRVFAAVRGVSAAVGVSKATAIAFQGTLLRRFQSRVPVRVIYNSVEVDTFKPDAADRSRKRGELGLSDSDIAFGIIGQITARKGQRELIKAFAEISPTERKATLLIAGVPIFNNDSSYFAKLQSQVQDTGLEGAIRFLGQVSETPSLLRALDVVVVNSHSEPFSLVLLEAMASGTPVLATKVDGIPELIGDGQTGFLLRPGDREHLKARMIELINDPSTRQAVAERGRKHAITDFPTRHFLNNFELLYRSFGSVEPVPVRNRVAHSPGPAAHEKRAL